MRWIVKVELVHEDGTTESLDLLSIERRAPETADEVGLRLEETKNMVARLQQLVVDEQLRQFVESRRTCPGCGVKRGVKDYRGRRLGTAHGVVLIRTPRFKPCRCPGACLDSPVLELLPGRITPELRHLQVKLATQLPYRQAADLLSTFLPRTSGLNHATTRRRTLAIGRAIDRELCDEIATGEASTAMRPAERMVVGIDGAFVKAKRTHGRRHFEVLAGRIEASGIRAGAAFAVVRDLDPLAKPRVRALLRRHGLTSQTALTVLTDGEEGIRGIVRTFLGQRPRYVLDWFHLSRRLARIRQAFSYLPNSSKLKQNEFTRLLRGIASARWRLWHGRPARARGALLLLRSDLQYLLIALRAVAPEKLQASGESRVEWVRGLVQELDKYLLSNWRALTNYCEERRTGRRIATSHVESTVNQVINQRMCKKQQMRWTRPGAQYLLHARTTEINGELARFTGLRRSAA